MPSENPTLLVNLTENGQAKMEPEFVFIGCSDSRVNEGTVFDARPGTLFMKRNIVKQFIAEDFNAYVVYEVMSRNLSLREKNAVFEVVEEPEPKNASASPHSPQHPLLNILFVAGLRALIEENVKVSVQPVAASTVIQDHFVALAQAGGVNEKGKTLATVSIHGRNTESSLYIDGLKD
ncbi:uncharacterized protein BT62DRAFT_918101 [Guyanagaster necrorhizus]|uniref:Carbonic anhydrase n=1 Tax=Guyanagaster necrorhizus TaxID=856835 RepID=A0A9P7VVV9_9AGAR|nr:uncharacterized protein BT62DRAFT_918101 [Guyanagaster necrorhizus MCA 3950]KAG7448486.1 hypothetical protein BT62DRAFT_918101 [Guyanagaster necrorhizus MCA 3950]